MFYPDWLFLILLSQWGIPCVIGVMVIPCMIIVMFYSLYHYRDGILHVIIMMADSLYHHGGAFFVLLS